MKVYMYMYCTYVLYMYVKDQVGQSKQYSHTPEQAIQPHTEIHVQYL